MNIKSNNKPYKPGDVLIFRTSNTRYVVIDVLPHSVLLSDKGGLEWVTRAFLKSQPIEYVSRKDATEVGV